ncbi:MAG: D-glycero-beta-D-manno-heptose 1-phosphate adenylyltransferase [bacterium]
MGILVSQEEIIIKLEKYRLKKVVFTNGCFDLLHIGHVRLLKRCRELGDVVVVGLNSDRSVCRLKGDGHPIFPQNERAEILSSLSFVDYVVIFNEDDPLNLIKIVKPDILVKGGDYTLEEIIGRKEVESWGGRVEIFPLVDGFSTTDIIDRIKRMP